MDSELKRELIIENYNNPVNKGLTNDSSYLKEEKNNSSCIDHFTLEIKLEDIDVMIKTLKHELTHVWLEEFGHNQHETKSYNNYHRNLQQIKHRVRLNLRSQYSYCLYNKRLCFVYRT